MTKKKSRDIGSEPKPTFRDPTFYLRLLGTFVGVGFAFSWVRESPWYVMCPVYIGAVMLCAHPDKLLSFFKKKD